MRRNASIVRYGNTGNRAFTLVEMMLVVLVLVIFLGFGLTSGTVIKDQLAFYRNQKVIIAQIYKARGLAVSTADKDGVCGYGVRLQGSEITVVRVGNGSNCDSSPVLGAAIPGTNSDPNPYKLEEGAVFSNNTTIVFIAPIPTVHFLSSSCVGLSIPSSDIRGAIKVNKFGQVSTAGSCN